MEMLPPGIIFEQIKIFEVGPGPDPSSPIRTWSATELLAVENLLYGLGMLDLWRGGAARKTENVQESDMVQAAKNYIAKQPVGFRASMYELSAADGWYFCIGQRDEFKNIS